MWVKSVGEQLTAGGRDDGHSMCAVPGMEQRADGVCSSLGTHESFHYLYDDPFKRIEKEGAKEKEVAEARENGKRPNEEGSGGTTASLDKPLSGMGKSMGSNRERGQQ